MNNSLSGSRNRNILVLLAVGLSCAATIGSHAVQSSKSKETAPAQPQQMPSCTPTPQPPAE